MKKKRIVSILILCILGSTLFACFDDSGTKVDRNKPTFLKKKRSKVITKHWKEHGAYPNDIYEAFDQVVDIVQAPLMNKGLFFRILKTKKVEKHYFFIIFMRNKAIREVMKGWDSPLLGYEDNPGSGVWTVTAGADPTAGEGKDNHLLFTYKDYKPRGSNLMVNGELAAMYRSQGLNAAGKLIPAIGFTPGKDDKTPFIDTLKITGLYRATLEFIYYPKDIVTAVTVPEYEAKIIGKDSMFSRKNMSKIEFTYNGLTISLDNTLREQLLYIIK